MVVIANYRPATERYILEWPAGLVDDKKGLKETGLRELEEEAGYIGTIGKALNSKNKTFSVPHRSDENVTWFYTEIDGDDPRNANPVQMLEEEENIKVHLIDFNESFVKSLQDLAVSHDYGIAAALRSLMNSICIYAGLPFEASTVEQLPAEELGMATI